MKRVVLLSFWVQGCNIPPIEVEWPEDLDIPQAGGKDILSLPVPGRGEDHDEWFSVEQRVMYPSKDSMVPSRTLLTLEAESCKLTSQQIEQAVHQMFNA